MPLPDFDTALARQKEVMDRMDASRYARVNHEPDPALVLEFHAAGLNVRRAIHAAHPTQYGNPDEHARPEEITIADTLNEREV